MSSGRVQAWLVATLLGVVTMVLVGGATRLTGSGLSIVEWKPVTGAIPPWSESAWNREFDLYRATPQFRLLNSRMTLPEFKRIYFWEYLHRLIGRLVGVVFAFPLFYWIARRRLDSRQARRLVPVLALGLAQGAIGWLMVKSGLVHAPHVSHYRLMLHLLTAFALFSWLLWLLLDERGARQGDATPAPASRPAIRILTGVAAALLVVQIGYGALTAGLRAGFSYNSFPKMLGSWFPPGFLSLGPVWRNFVDNGPAVQWMHRWLGALLLVSVWGARAALRGVGLKPSQRRALRGLSLALLAQYALGVSTLLGSVPIGLGVLHQLGACVCLAMQVWLAHATFRDSKDRQDQFTSALGPSGQ